LTTVLIPPTKIAKEKVAEGEHMAPATVMYTERETETLKEIFTLLVRNQPQMIYQIMTENPATLEQNLQLMLTMSLISGTVFRLVRFFIEEEFNRVLKDETPVVDETRRGDAIFADDYSPASIFLSLCFAKLGHSYLKELMGEFVTDIIINERKISWELNPSFTDGDELLQNQKMFQRKVDIFVKNLVSKEAVDKMPVGIRAICGYICEMTSQWQTEKPELSLDYHVFIGRALVLRYFNQALSQPEKLLSKPVTQGASTKRNFFLVEKLLQHVVTSEPFRQKEEFLSVFHDLANDKRTLIFNWISEVLVPSTTALIVPGDLNVVVVHDLLKIHTILNKKVDALEATEDGPGQFIGFLVRLLNIWMRDGCDGG